MGGQWMCACPALWPMEINYCPLCGARMITMGPRSTYPVFTSAQAKGLRELQHRVRSGDLDDDTMTDTEQAARRAAAWVEFLRRRRERSAGDEAEGRGDDVRDD